MGNIMSDKKEQATKEFAVIEAAGKQYKVKVGDIVSFDKPFEGFKAGEKITFDKVLLVETGADTKVGTPYVDGAKVEGIFEAEGKSKKILVWRFRAKSRYSRKYGHRQPFTSVKISAIK